MDSDPDNRIFFDHGGLTAFDDGKNQLLSPSTLPSVQREFQQEVSRSFMMITAKELKCGTREKTFRHFYRIVEVYQWVSSRFTHRIRVLYLDLLSYSDTLVWLKSAQCDEGFFFHPSAYWPDVLCLLAPIAPSEQHGPKTDTFVSMSSLLRSMWIWKRIRKRLKFHRLASQVQFASSKTSIMYVLDSTNLLLYLHPNLSRVRTSLRSVTSVSTNASSCPWIVNMYRIQPIWSKHS